MKMGLVCNACGKKIKFENGMPVEDFLRVKKDWGYFSSKDGKTMKFVLCEPCCDKLAKTFKFDAAYEDTVELL